MVNWKQIENWKFILRTIVCIMMKISCPSSGHQQRETEHHCQCLHLNQLWSQLCFMLLHYALSTFELIFYLSMNQTLKSGEGVITGYDTNEITSFPLFRPISKKPFIMLPAFHLSHCLSHDYSLTETIWPFLILFWHGFSLGQVICVNFVSIFDYFNK